VLLRAVVRLGGLESTAELCPSSWSFRVVGFRDSCPGRDYLVLNGVDLVVAGELAGVDGWGRLGFAVCYCLGICKWHRPLCFGMG
jgi:hypothetical protein